MACWSREHKESIRRGVQKYWNELAASEKKVKTQNFNKFKPGHTPPDWVKARAIESLVGGFWYGNVKNDIPNRSKQINKYCELWTEDLKERIRAYWGHVSTLSGNPETSIYKKTVIIKNISCHHVYYQKKACCIWDEDEKGYYANINTGTKRNPKIIKYYIGGDPNKFVVLTASEHKKTDFNKLYWIKTFENIIEEQGGKCYFTNDDITKLLDSE